MKFEKLKKWQCENVKYKQKGCHIYRIISINTSKHLVYGSNVETYTNDQKRF